MAGLMRRRTLRTWTLSASARRDADASAERGRLSLRDHHEHVMAVEERLGDQRAPPASKGRPGPGQPLRHLDRVDLVHRVHIEQVMTDRPAAERSDRGPLALAARRRELVDLGQIRADRRRGQRADLAVVMPGELDQVPPVGADRLTGALALDRSVRKSARCRASGCSGPSCPVTTGSRPPSPKLPDNQESNRPRQITGDYGKLVQAGGSPFPSPGAGAPGSPVGTIWSGQGGGADARRTRLPTPLDPRPGVSHRHEQAVRPAPGPAFRWRVPRSRFCRVRQ